MQAMRGLPRIVSQLRRYCERTVGIDVGARANRERQLAASFEDSQGKAAVN